MADFTAVIQRAVDGLSDKSPEMRVKVYEKAKAAVQRQLNAMNPPPSEDLVARQMQKIDAAIAEIEATFATEPVAADVHEEPVVEEPAAETVAAAEEQIPAQAHHRDDQQEPETQQPEAEAPAEPEDTTEVEEPSVEPETQPLHEAPSVEPEADFRDESAHAEEEPYETPEPEEPQGTDEREWSAPYDADRKTEEFEDAPQPEDAPTAFVGGKRWGSPPANEHYEAPFPDADAPLIDEQAYEEEPKPAAEHNEKSVDPVDADPFLAEIADSHSRYDAPENDPLQDQEWDIPSIDDAPEYQSEEHIGRNQDDVHALLDEPYVAAPTSSESNLPDEEEDIAVSDEAQSGYTSRKSEPDIDRIVSRIEEQDDDNGRGGILRTVVIAALALIVVAGLSFAGWQYRDEIAAMFGTSGTDIATTDNGGDDGPVTADDQNQADGGATADQQPTVTGPEKFTQRLLADGTEVEGEAGPAPTGDEEGKSIAQQEGGTSAPVQQSNDTSAQASKSVKMFLYEERLGQASPTAIEGNVTWTRELETQDVGNPEPVIQAKIEIPERSMSALITFKRNLDPSLPASHIVELVFSLPENFEGGGIESVVRISMKANEQDQGQALIGVPARITDYFHMIALNSLPEAQQTNLELLRTLDWMDIPLVYGNGRRALLTLEKGAEGKAVFNQVLKEWSQETSGQ
ncbi:hypothetical protein [Rhizobium sp. L1K21]|uniref:hypothetical protein n=1 Tax=Rhizobium sp. L1K21 TaxID=2954933 RepID=UPI0020937B14|nr:hypothetical protein [Rhizobium sp. L1K21]MCO6185151.1 hypothetical protein [Rhizobium sp. L1K21]